MVGTLSCPALLVGILIGPTSERIQVICCSNSIAVAQENYLDAARGVCVLFACDGIAVADVQMIRVLKRCLASLFVKRWPASCYGRFWEGEGQKVIPVP